MLRRRAGIFAATLVTGVVASFGGAAPASATQECRGASTGTQTIGVLGQEIYHTPGTSTWICVTYPASLPAPPSIEVTTTPARIVQLVHPDAGGEQIEVSVFTAVMPYDGPGQQVNEARTLPIPMDGGKTCLFFQGNDVYNPGGCVIFVNGVTTLDDAINDILDDLPLP